jgi:hypothetical protein
MPDHVTERPRAAALRTILVGGGLAGLLDIAYALLVAWFGGGPPIRVLHAIASGVLGREAFAGGGVTASLGLTLHFVIACGAAATFLAASRWWPWLLRRPLVTGPIFGLCVWAVMYLAVLPITFGRPWSMPAALPLAGQLAIHALGVGLPIALVASGSALVASRPK